MTCRVAGHRVAAKFVEAVRLPPPPYRVVLHARARRRRAGRGDRGHLDRHTPIAPRESPVLIADEPERPSERGLAGPGLLAKTIVYRWQDHLPLYRQEKIHARDGAGPKFTLGAFSISQEL